jgi:hypothetical protein
MKKSDISGHKMTLKIGSGERVTNGQRQRVVTPGVLHELLLYSIRTVTSEKTTAALFLISLNIIH